MNNTRYLLKLFLINCTVFSNWICLNEQSMQWLISTDGTTDCYQKIHGQRYSLVPFEMKSEICGKLHRNEPRLLRSFSWYSYWSAVVDVKWYPRNIYSSVAFRLIIIPMMTNEEIDRPLYLDVFIRYSREFLDEIARLEIIRKGFSTDEVLQKLIVDWLRSMSSYFITVVIFGFLDLVGLTFILFIQIVH